MLDRFRPHKLDSLLGDVTDVDRYLFRAFLVRERPDAPNHFARAITFFDDPVHGAARFVQVWDISVEPTQAGPRSADYGRKRLVYLMRDRGRHLSQHRDTSYMREFRLRLA